MLLLNMLEAVYVDCKGAMAIVTIRPKAPFPPILQVATTREGARMVSVNEPPEFWAPEAHDHQCFLWRLRLI